MCNKLNWFTITHSNVVLSIIIIKNRLNRCGYTNMTTDYTILFYLLKLSTDLYHLSTKLTNAFLPISCHCRNQHAHLKGGQGSAFILTKQRHRLSIKTKLYDCMFFYKLRTRRRTRNCLCCCQTI